MLPIKNKYTAHIGLDPVVAYSFDVNTCPP